MALKDDVKALLKDVEDLILEVEESETLDEEKKAALTRDLDEIVSSIDDILLRI